MMKPDYRKTLVSILLLVCLLAASNLTPAGAAGGNETPPWPNDNPVRGRPDQLNAAALTLGGPDLYGYVSNTTTYNGSLDLTASGTQVIFAPHESINSYKGPFPLGFSFKFYENSYTEVYLSTSGFLSFEEPYGVHQDKAIPNRSIPNNIISPLGMNIWLDNVSKIYYQMDNSNPASPRFIVEWNNVINADNGDALTFQAILKSNGDIIFQYKSLGAVARSYWVTVGIEDKEGLDGLMYATNISDLTASSAVLFVRPPVSRRVKFLSAHHGGFVVDNNALIPIKLRNTGELGNDIYNVSAAHLAGETGWNVSFVGTDGATPIPDPDNDGVIQTSIMTEGETLLIYVSVTPSGAPNVGDYTKYRITAASAANPAARHSMEVMAAVPAPFAQALAGFGVGVVEGISIDLVRPSHRVTNRVADWFSGSSMALSYMHGNGYIFMWERNDDDQTLDYTNLEYGLILANGFVRRSRTVLADNGPEAQANPSLQISDIGAALVTNTQGQTGVAWIREIYDYGFESPNSGKSNFNVYFAVLNSNGDPQVNEVNLTNNTTWALTGVKELKSVSVSANSNGNFTVAWVDRRGAANGTNRTSNIWRGVYNPAGQVVMAPAVMTNSTADVLFFDNPMLTHLSSGSTLALYDGYNNTTSAYAMYYQVLNEAGGVQTGQTTLTGINGYKADVFEMSNGNILLGWTNFTDHRVGYAMLSPNYAYAAGPAYLENPDGLLAAYISVTADRAGYGIMTWMDNELNSRVYYALVNGDGVLLTPPLDSYPISPDQAFIISNTSGLGNAPNELVFLTYLPLIRR